MNAPANIAPVVRRFQVPDLDTHGAWMLPRLQATFKHLNDRALVGFLRGLINSNEYLFLFEPDSVGLAQVVRSHSLQPKPVVWERFVWARVPDNAEMQAKAAFMYDHFRQWARSMHCENIIVQELSDVPIEMVRAHMGRIFTRQQQYVRIGAAERQ